MGGVRVAGNKLGKAYSFPGLLNKRGVDSEPERDLRALIAAANWEINNQDYYAHAMLACERSATIAPTIRMLWERFDKPTIIEGKFYTLHKDNEFLRLACRGGDEIAHIPVNSDNPATGNGLLIQDVERMMEIEQILRSWELEQKHNAKEASELGI